MVIVVERISPMVSGLASLGQRPMMRLKHASAFICRDPFCMVQFFFHLRSRKPNRKIVMHRHFLAALVSTSFLLAAPGVVAQTQEAPASYAAMTVRDKADALLTYFINGTKGAMDAEARLMATVGMKAEADLALAQSSAFVHESTPGQMEEVILLRTNGNAALAKKLSAGGIALTDAQKAEFATNIQALAPSVTQFNELMTDFPELKKALRDAGLKRKKALFVSRFLPQALADSKLSLGAALAFARANNIVVAPAVAELAK